MSLRVAYLLGLVAGIVGNAHALTCYEIVDSGDETLYRAAVPPFPLAGPEWSAAQDRLRKEGRLLLWFDSQNCPENFSSPTYASVKAAESPTDLLAARSARSAGIYTRESSSPPTAVGAGGRAPVVVSPAGAAGGGAGVGYSR
jgi:hypothetical protein